MNITLKRTAALELLAPTGILRSNCEPPFLRLLWRLGVDVPPPNLASFWHIAVFSGVYFAMGWGLGWWFLAPLFLVSPIAVFWPACAAGLGFGFFMAAYYAYGARKHGIPRWHEFYSVPLVNNGA